MSLINDALKRAKQLQKKPPVPPGTETPLQPTEGAAPQRRTSPVILAGSLVLVALAGWFLWQWWEKSNAPAQLAAVTPKTNAPAASPTNEAAPKSRFVASMRQATNVAATVAKIQQSDTTVQEQPPTTPPVATREVKAPAEREPTNETPIAPTPTASVKTNEVASSPDTSARPSPRAVAFPALTLQGVYYRLKNPSALINNRTLYVGDEIDGARVAEIMRYAVKVEMGGQFKELTLK